MGDCMSRTRSVIIDGIPERRFMEQWVDSISKFEEQLIRLEEAEKRRSSEISAQDGQRNTANIERPAFRG